MTAVEVALPPTIRRNLLELIPVGVVLLAEGDRVVWSNSRAEAVLARSSGIRLFDGRLCGAGTARPRGLRAVLDAVLAGDDANCPAHLVKLTDGPGATRLLLLGLTPDAMPLALPGPLVLVAIWDDDEPPRPSGAVARCLYGLTPAEARVATSIATGRTVAAIADELSVQANTVRAHLKSIYGKTGAVGQADLVRRLLCGPAGLGCFSRGLMGSEGC